VVRRVFSIREWPDWMARGIGKRKIFLEDGDYDHRMELVGDDLIGLSRSWDL